LKVGHLAENLLVQLLDRRIRVRVALPLEEVGRDRKIAKLGEAPADIGDMFVHAERLVNHDDHGQMRLALRLCPISGHQRIARLDADFARLEAFAVRMDRLRGHGQHACREASAERRLDEGAPVEGNMGNETVDFWLQHAVLLFWNG
jgi:hypothetical protein